MMVYIALEQYDVCARSEIAARKDFDGVVLGDLFCQKRMFAYGEPELTEWASALAEAGKTIVFQTPGYLTERNFESSARTVRYLIDRGWCRAALVQDVGFAKRLHDLVPELSLVWSQHASIRNSSENLYFYEFLRTVGIDAVEIIRQNRAPHLQKMGFAPVYASHELTFQTVNRECYYLHEHDVWDGECGRACILGASRMTNENCGLDMRIDGFQLGKQYVRTDAEPALLSGVSADVIRYYPNWTAFLEDADRRQSP